MSFIFTQRGGYNENEPKKQLTTAIVENSQKTMLSTVQRVIISTCGAPNFETNSNNNAYVCYEVKLNQLLRY